jgi:predicted membrane protein
MVEISRVSNRLQLSSRLVLGIVVIVLGTLWTLDNLDLIESEPILHWWPVLLVGVGVAKLFGIGGHRNAAAGTVLMLVGGWLLAGGLGIGWMDLSTLWPMVLIVIGVNLVIRSYRAQALGSPTEDLSSRLGTFAFWSGMERKVSSQAFVGGDITAVMGGAKIDFTQAKPVPGGAVMDVFVWWGGLDLRVPEDWKVVLEATVLMGGVEDKAKSAPAESTNVLILRGLVIMGGIEIKN